MPEPTLKNDFNAVHENFKEGSQWLVNHNISDLIVASVIVCHTIAHAPYPVNASVMPTTPLIINPIVLDIAIIFTSIFFINRLVCTMAVALMINDKNITRERGIMRGSFWKHHAINGAQNQRITYSSVAIPMLNHNTVL